MKPGLMGSRRASGGFSLIELMISVVIGLIALGVATRLVVSSETNKQAAMGGSDSMQNGVLALFSVERELNQAGWGLNDPMINGCDTNFYDGATGGGYALLDAPRGGATVRPLAAVVIKNVVDGSDLLSINAGSSFSNAGSIGLGKPYASGSQLVVDRLAYGFNGTATVPAGGDVIVVAPEAASTQKCSVAMVSSSVPGADNSLMIAAGGANRFNSGSLSYGYSAPGTRIFNLGPAANLAFHTWSVGSGGFLTLRATNLPGTQSSGQAVTDNIVGLKAQYGLDNRAGAAFTPELGMNVGLWSSTMTDADSDGTAGSAGDYTRIAAVRVAVLARARNPEKPNLTTGQCTATTTVPTAFGGAVAMPVSVTGDAIPWQCYRYRVFETIVPIRNSGWRPTP
jgi:type IV pilus assembly protein PilW